MNVSVIIIAFVIVNSFSNSADEDDTYNINKEQIIDGIKISDGLIIQDKGLNTYTANITNTKSEIDHVERISFNFYDKESKKIITLYGYVGKDLSSNETTPHPPLGRYFCAIS